MSQWGSKGHIMCNYINEFYHDLNRNAIVDATELLFPNDNNPLSPG